MFQKFVQFSLAFIFLGTTATLALAGSQSLGNITLLSIEPRVLTPNGDSLNDVAYFKFDTNLAGLPLESTIRDINGAKVSNMVLNSNETALLWNGKDSDGRTVPAGIYIYSIKIGKNVATGTVVVGR